MNKLKLTLKFFVIISFLAFAYGNCSKRLTREDSLTRDADNTNNDTSNNDNASNENSPDPTNSNFVDIITHPGNQVIDLASGSNQNVNLSVFADSDEALSYQWYFNDGSISGATARVLTISDIQLSDGGKYKVKVSTASVAGVFSASAQLTVSDSSLGTGPPVINSQPGALDGATPGQDYSFLIMASGANLTYQWTFQATGQSTFLNMTGETSPTLQLNSVSAANEGIYKVIIANSLDTVSSNEVVLRLSSGADPDPDPTPNGVLNQVATGSRHVCHIDSEKLACWGNNDRIAVSGQASGYQVSNPVSGLSSGVTAVAAAANNTCAIKDSKLYCWGYNDYSLVGDGSVHASATNSDGYRRGAKISAPFETSTAIQDPIASIALGRKHACAVTTTGRLYCWGRNKDGSNRVLLGDPNNKANMVRRPTQVPTMQTGVTHVSLGTNFTCAIQSGALKCWGNNGHGRLGRGGNAGTLAIPTNVSGLGSGVTNVGSGFNHTCAIHNSDLKCWGRNNHGQIGNNTRKSDASTAGVNAPASIISNFGAGLFGLGENSTCVNSTANQELNCWGSNANKQLGLGPNRTKDHYLTPEKVDTFARVSSLSRPSNRTRCLIDDADGKTYCWGLNSHKQIDKSASTSKKFDVPTLVSP